MINTGKKKVNRRPSEIVDEMIRRAFLLGASIDETEPASPLPGQVIFADEEILGLKQELLNRIERS